MLKHFLFALFPATIPSMIAIMPFSSHVHDSGNLAIFLQIATIIFFPYINPMTYIIALIFGFISYKSKKIWIRLLFQIVTFPTIYICIILLVHLLIYHRNFDHHFLNTLYFNFFGVATLCFILSILSIVSEKIYNKHLSKRNTKAPIAKRRDN